MVGLSIKMIAININLKIKVKKKVSEYSLVSITVEKKKKKKPCIKLVLDFVFTSFDITPMLLNNLSNFYLHLFNLTFGLDLYL